MIRRPPRSTQSRSSAASDVYKRQKWLKTYHAKLATPIGIPSLVLGHMLWSGARVLMVSVVFAVIMTAFRVAPLFESLLAVGPALLVGLAMAAVTTAFTSRLAE